mmetsp:Transcript_14690/g.18458  ORF Transcript_14690/g.18458 Transcript_14690/m.18458 type:complete len:81 (-) Transcript_14690:105-347(-)
MKSGVYVSSRLNSMHTVSMAACILLAVSKFMVYNLALYTAPISKASELIDQKYLILSRSYQTAGLKNEEGLDADFNDDAI